MKKYLVATKNLDKYEIAKGLLADILSNSDCCFCNLKDLDVHYEITETGSIEERSRQKSAVFWEYIKKDKQIAEDICASVGIDDGFGLSRDEEGDPNSKQLTDKILTGHYLKEGELIWLKRGFAVCGEKLKLKSCLTSIPFVFLGNRSNIKREEGKYPLSSVLGSIGQKKTIIEMNFRESIEYYLKYCKSDLIELFRKEK